LGRVVQLESKKTIAGSPLTPELKDFIDRVIVPILVKQYLAEEADAAQLAKKGRKVAQSSRNTAAFQFSGDVAEQ
jgi:hypothetical protein